MPGEALKLDDSSFDFIVDEYGVHIIKLGHEPFGFQLLPQKLSVEKPVARQGRQLRLGYSVIERDAFGLPFLITEEYGHVIYYETEREFVAMPVTSESLRQMAIKTTKPLAAASYMAWSHAWGWLLVLALTGAAWFELQALRRRREAAGLL